MCLLLFGLLQVSHLFAAREVLDYAAVAAARARAVGFNDFMVHKVHRVASIPNAGRLENPIFERSGSLVDRWRSDRPGALWAFSLASAPSSPQYGIEQSRIPLYLGAERWGELQPILDYEDWDTVRLSRMLDTASETVHATMRQDVPLRHPFHRAYYAADEVEARGEAELDSHYSLYLE
jgi:hypothetical protein